MPVVAVIEKVLLDVANGAQSFGSGEFPEELQLYRNDVDMHRLKAQLLMLPDLIRTRNSKLSNSVPIKRVTNVRTICDIMNEISISKEM